MPAVCHCTDKNRALNHDCSGNGHGQGIYRVQGNKHGVFDCIFQKPLGFGHRGDAQSKKRGAKPAQLLLWALGSLDTLRGWQMRALPLPSRVCGVVESFKKGDLRMLDTHEVHDDLFYLWPKFDECKWVPLPDQTFVLLDGVPSQLNRRALVYKCSKGNWGASYEGWEPTLQFNPHSHICGLSLALKQRFSTPLDAAIGLKTATKEGFCSQRWNVENTPWVALCWLDGEGPSHVCRWLNGRAYEVRRWNKGVWHLVRDSRYATDPNIFEESKSRRMTFKSIEHAVGYVDSKIEPGN